MLDAVKADNRAWAGRMVDDDPDFFSRHVDGQEPPYLWLGCSDSRAPAEAITAQGLGQLFVHRNIANLCSPKDLSAQAVLQYAVAELQVRHILVVGHYGCGGVKAALEHAPAGPVDAWIEPIRKLRDAHKDELGPLKGEASWKRLVELNVVAQVRNVAGNRFVAKAWKAGRKLGVHGLVYRIADGRLKDLDVSVASPEAVARRWP